MVTLSNFSESGSVDSKRVEILGLFGSGKTTLARRLASIGFAPIYENHHKVHMWEKREMNATVGYLPYDLGFLLHHFESTVDACDAEGVSLCDWSFLTDRLWASLRLGNDFPAYALVHDRLTSRVRPALKYIYLKTPAELLIDRIKERGRPEELALKLDEIRLASEALERLVQQIDASKVIVFESMMDRYKGDMEMLSVLANS